MTKDELVALLPSRMKGLISYLDPEDYSSAADDASLELGWDFPVSDAQKFWTIERAKRWLFFYLLTQQAHKFQFEKINLQHRFDHYSKIVGLMDRRFEVAIEENPALFAGVDTRGLFGTYVYSGYSTDELGYETTYSDDNVVEFFPNEES